MGRTRRFTRHVGRLLPVLWYRFVLLIAGIAALLYGLDRVDTKDGRTLGGILIASGIALGAEAFRSIFDAIDRDRAARHRDLDETRRMLYMAYAALHGEQGTRSEIAGTTVNALAHHADRPDRLPIDDAVQLATTLQISPGASSDLQYLIVSEIERITAELGDSAPDDLE